MRPLLFKRRDSLNTSTSIRPIIKKIALPFDESKASRYNARLLGQLAQLVEQRIENPRVRGSIPRLATIFKAQPFSVGLFHIWSFPKVCAVSVDFACAIGIDRLAAERLLTRPVGLFFALGSQKISENFVSRAHAETLSRQALAIEVLHWVRRIDHLPPIVEPDDLTAVTISPWEGADHCRSCCAPGCDRSRHESALRCAG